MRKKSVTSGVIQSTKRYGKFKLLPTNRDIHEPHVKSLLAEFEESGNITQVSPIVVTPKMEVIDGQHRLEACARLGLPVFYKVLDNLSIKDARRMNIAQRRWRTEDYLMSYVNEGLEPYEKFLTIWNEYKEYGVSYSIVILFSQGVEEHYRGYGSGFRSGHLKDFDMNEARERLDKLVDLININQDFKLKALAIAVLKVMGSEYYDHDRMVRKAQKRAQEIRAYQSIEDNKRMLENIYNHEVKVNRVRLF